MEAWKEHYKPILIGHSLLILPAWMESPDPRRIPIRIDPGMAFGTGAHPTTQLSLELMETYFDNRGWSTNHGPSLVIDVGCGSGILSIAALKLGAARALGVDIDFESVKNSRQNAEINGIGDELSLGQGSVRDVLEARFSYTSAPLVVANILAPVIIRLFDEGLADLVETKGGIILSGILIQQEESVLEAAQAGSLKRFDKRRMGDWTAFLLRK
jgi:ribosomal protein L11 methyltransferase